MGLQILYYQQITMLSSALLIISGGIDLDHKFLSRRVSIWNPLTNEIVYAPNLPEPRFMHIQTFYDDRLYVFGGKTSAEAGQFQVVASCHCFDVKLMQWLPLPQMPRPRCAGTAFKYKHAIYLLCGKRAAPGPPPIASSKLPPPACTPRGGSSCLRGCWHKIIQSAVCA